MQVLGSCRRSILFIYIFFMSLYIAEGNTADGYVDCLFANDRDSFNGTVLSEQKAKWILSGGLSNPSREIPTAPKKLYSKVKDNKLIVAWLANPRVLYGVEFLEHIMLKVVQYYTSSKTYRYTEYILFNVSGVHSMTKYSYNCTKIIPGTYEIATSLWFIGKIVFSNDSHLTTAVDKSSRSEIHVVPRQNLLPDLKEAKAATENCICNSKISIRIDQIPSSNTVSARIQALGLSNDTTVEIQLIHDGESKIKERVNISGQDLQETYSREFKVERGKGYYIRVLRHCQRKYKGILSCGKDEADVIRSDDFTLQTGSYIPWTSSKVERYETKDSLQVLQIAAITFTFCLSIALYLALIIKLSTGKFCPKRKSSKVTKRSTYVRLNSRGGTSTRLTSSKRVAIIFAKDSQKHEENVTRISDELTQRGVNSVLFDETASPEIMANWVQAAENVVTNFEVVIFIISPLTYEICKKDGIFSTNFKEENEEINESRTYTQILTRFPAAVLSTLKTGQTWADTNKAICVSLCLAETKEEYKRLSSKMRKEHPLVFKDKIYFHNLRNAKDSNNRKLIRKIIRAIN